MTDTPTRRTQEQRRAETARRVLDAATELIARTGSRSVTLAQVGEAAGYSRGIVYHQFGSRERLVEAVLDRAQQLDLPEYAGDGLEHLVGIVESYLRAVSGGSVSTLAFLQLWMEAVAADPVVAPLFARRDEEFRRFLHDAVRRGVADGTVRSDADPDAAGSVLMALLRGAGLQFVATPPVADAPALIREAVRTVRTAFAATS
ncbi:TetR/AcrR family transcriptional regulator [Pseudonocardia broussonetiae]|uniref:TetR/AcrR family transcriptional regulator n=1 Tax=Pseudonocardia broussonetiae TaxID=2736640 RepID=A0A6M6JJ37_9PSEU|nr:TetR/AcrR family transcriptional regulator [Pseudonocardia broussonetiae]QJY48114.1 TetR/AcrR family transcriptional regulator [Pseudonocardia broussonetiae]